MIGAPNKAVTALMGNKPCVKDTCDRQSQTSNTLAPHKTDAGKTIR